MSKYIDAEKLYKKVDELMAQYAKSEEDMDAEGYTDWATFYHGKRTTCSEVLNIIISLQQPEVDYNKFEKLFGDFCERNKGHHITSHDACMWFWELGLNARKEE